MKVRSFRTRVALGFMVSMTGLLAVATILTLYHAHLHPDSMLWLHNSMISVSALAGIGVGLLVVRRALAPFDTLRGRLAAVREGRARTIEGRFPDEVQPLVEDLNDLLVHRDRMVERAMARAGDLAHGLKTPLAILQREADRAAAGGQPELASAIATEVERMRRQVGYHLAQARAAGSGATAGVTCLVAESAAGLARTLRRLRPDGPSIEVEVDGGHAVRVSREDLDEMLGNLLDNACSWARRHVRLRSTAEAETIVVTIEDDGPGLPADQWERVLQRGVRAGLKDDAGPGTGLGLAIVRELAELHGGHVTLGRSQLGGLGATLTLPRR
jgi:signal transduction histidine kinase